MQEAPDPMTKLTWGNAALISPATARAQNLNDGDVVTITPRELQNGSGGDGRSPVIADDAIVISLGHGRAKCGRVGKDVGYNANLIRTSDAQWFADGVSIAPTGATVKHGHYAGARHRRSAT